MSHNQQPNSKWRLGNLDLQNHFEAAESLVTLSSRVSPFVLWQEEVKISGEELTSKMLLDMGSFCTLEAAGAKTSWWNKRG